MEDLHSEVVPREFLCCPLCRDEYHEPKYLPCLHSFCAACIDDHIEANSKPDSSFTCPVCDTEIIMADQAPVQLPDNAFARRLSCPSTTRCRRERKCGSCEGTATVHCINCDEFLCQQCSLGHLQQVETSSHRTQDIDHYEDGEVATQQPTLQRCCQYYDDMDIGCLFCVDCELLACPECHNTKHADHRCAELGAIAQNFENKIKQPLEELKKDSATLHKVLSKLELARQQATNNMQDLKTAARQRTDVLCNMIREYENILVLEIEKKHAQNVSAIKEREATVRNCIESIKAVTELTDKLLTFGSEEEKVSMRRKIGRRVRELCEEELPMRTFKLVKRTLNEPNVTVDMVCEMFGDLRKEASPASRRKIQTASQSIDLGMMSRRMKASSVSSTEEIVPELAGLEEEEEEDTDMLSASNTSDAFRPGSSLLSLSANSNDDFKMAASVSPRLAEVPDTNVHSSTAHDQVPCHNLDSVLREMRLPDPFLSESIKGVGVNQQGNILVATVSPGGCSKVFILEKHAIVIGQIPIEKSWVVHSISADGKVNLVLPRSENKYKVRIMSGENSVNTLADVQIESFGLNSVTATREGKILVSANRYATANSVHGRSAKYGGNITIYAKDGTLERVITNETFTQLNLYLFDRPQHIAVDAQGCFFVTDPGRHSVLGFKPNGEFMFEYGNTDAEEELYQGPDAVCTDTEQNVIVFDKRDGRIDILSYEGHLQRCYFPSEHIRFISTTPDKCLLLVNSQGDLKFFNYL
ncbi:E3 ubiquitin-protein ligase TRIM56-like isoform X2 [Physella acuta]|nr:E3 ubiquitin-protein ligase TRIM56-like isoform X2 [Physella acuta]